MKPLMVDTLTPFTRANEIVTALGCYRFPLSDEKVLQAAMADAFTARRIPFEREVHLGPCDVVDFMIEAVAIEVKIKGARRLIYRQLERYAEHTRVQVLILATNVPMGLPPMINGKFTFIAQLGRGWL